MNASCGYIDNFVLSFCSWCTISITHLNITSSAYVLSLYTIEHWHSDNQMIYGKIEPVKCIVFFFTSFEFIYFFSKFKLQEYIV